MTGPPDPVRPVLVSAYEVYQAAKARGTDPAAGEAFDPSNSPLYGRAVFLMGAPRSGTTWLQQLLVLHPQIATAGETHIFCEGLGELLTNHAGEDPYWGLSAWVTRPELLTLMRELIDGVMLRMRDAIRPEATHVLDKTPNHIPYAAQVAATHPDAAFIQIIRDGRDAAASAKQLWTWSKDYGSFGRNATRWRDAVLDCRTHLSGLRYCEVRYEELLADAPAQLARIYDTIGLPYDADFLQQSAAFGKTPVNVRPSRPEVGSRKWAGLPAYAERQVVRQAGDLLVELGYITPERRRELARARPLGDLAARWQRPQLPERVRKPRRYALRARAQALADAITAQDRQALVTCLSPDAELSGPRPSTGRDAVADALLELLGGSTVLALEADHVAGTLRWSGAEGSHLLQVSTSGDLISKLAVS